MQRADTEVCHEVLSEPFLRENYPEKFAKIEAVRLSLNNSIAAPGYDDALASLTDPPSGDGKRMKFSKEVSYFCDFDKVTPHILAQFRHVFLVRRPLDVVQSLYRVGQAGFTAYFDPEEAGFSELHRIHAMASKACDPGDMLVLESDEDLMRDPQACLRRFCAFCGLPFDDKMLRWKSESVPSWQFFKGWHDDAERSSGFQNPKHEEIEFPPIVGDVAQACEPIYRAFAFQARIDREAPVSSRAILLRETETARAGLLVRVEDRHTLSRALDLAAALPSEIDIWASCGAGGELPALDDNLYDRPVFILSDPGRALPLMPGRCVPATFELVAHGDAAGDSHDPEGRIFLPDGADVGAAAALVTKVIERELKALGADGLEMAERACLGRAPSPATSDWREFFLALKAEEDVLVLTDGASDWTGPDLVDVATRLRIRVEDAAAGPGWVALRMDRSANTVISMAACLLAGYPFVEIPGWYTLEQEDEVVSRLNPVLVICDRADRLQNHAGPRVEIGEKLLGQAPFPSPPATACPPPASASPSSTAYGVLTSGTTGVAKVVEIPHSAMLGSWDLWHGAIRPGDRLGINAWLPGYIFYAMFSKATSVVIPDPVIVDPAALSAFADRTALNQMMITPTVCAGLFNEDDTLPDAFCGFRIFWLSGENVSRSLALRLKKAVPGADVIDLYGSNEAGDIAVRRDGTALTPVAGSQAMILDGLHQPVASGCVGNLFVGGPQLFSCYMGDRDLTDASFIENPLHSRHDRAVGKLFRTGDYARQLPDGAIEVVSRETAQTKIRGFKVLLPRVEAVLAQHSQVRHVVVEAEGEGTDRQLVAWILPEDRSAPPTSNALLDFARLHLPYYALPALFFQLTSLPAGSSQKSARLSATTDRAPLLSQETLLGETEAQVAGIWRWALGGDRPAFRPFDDFIELGGSLLLAKVVHRLSEDMGVAVRFEDVFQDTTLAGMSALIDALRSGMSVARRRTDIDAEIAAYRVVGDATIRRDDRRGSPSKTYFVTGGTGYFGRYLLRALAGAQDTGQVIALVRGTSGEPASDRLMDGLAGTMSEEALSKIHAVEGCLDEAGFGLSAPRLDAICASVDCVVHAGADVNWIKPYTALAATNVSATATAVKIAVRSGASLVFLSTLAEEIPSTGYNESKLVSEGIVASARRDLALNYAILRCGDLAAPSRHGQGREFNENDYVACLLGACLEIGCWPQDVGWSINLLPVDHAATLAASVAAGRLPETTNATLNLVHPLGDLDFASLCKTIESLRIGPTFCSVRYAEWRRAILGAGSAGGFSQRAALLLDLSIADLEAPTDRSNVLDPAALPCPALDVAWIAAFAGALMKSPVFARKDLPDVDAEHHDGLGGAATGSAVDAAGTGTAAARAG